MAVGADEGGVAVHGDRGAEPVGWHGRRSSELGLLRPGRAAAREDVRGAGLDVAGDGVVRSADNGRVAAEGDGGAEGVQGGRVRCDQLRLLRPHAVRAREDVCGAGLVVRAVRAVGSADKRRVTGDRDRGAEGVPRGRVYGEELRLLCPVLARARGDVHGAGAVQS